MDPTPHFPAEQCLTLNDVARIIASRRNLSELFHDLAEGDGRTRAPADTCHGKNWRQRFSQKRCSGVIYMHTTEAGEHAIRPVNGGETRRHTVCIGVGSVPSYSTVAQIPWRPAYTFGSRPWELLGVVPTILPVPM